MPFFGLLYKALKNFFSATPANKGERDQPAPLEVEREHLRKQLEALDQAPQYEADREP